MISSSGRAMKSALVAAVGLSGIFAGAVVADEAGPSPERQRMLEELASLRRQITGLETQQSDGWLTERRAEEVKSLIGQVLSDAATRSSLLDDGMTGGHDGDHFYLSSQDGNFALNVSGQIQTRYSWTHRHPDAPVEEIPDIEESSGSGTGSSIEEASMAIDTSGRPSGLSVFDQDEMGLEIPRAKLRFWGHLLRPSFFYELELAVDSVNNKVFADRIVVGYRPAEGLVIWGGEDKAPFLREELVDSSRQLAVERSLLNEIFTLGYVQGLWVQWTPTWFLRITGSVNDGLRSGEAFGAGGFSAPSFGEENTDFAGDEKSFVHDAADFALTGRLEIRLAGGGWDLLEDFSSWSGQETAMFLGTAIHYEVGETGDGQKSARDKDFSDATGAEYDRFVMWTTDVTYKSGGFNLFGAVVGTHILGFDGREEVEHIGALVQTGLMVVPDKFEPFFRAEWFSMADPGALGDQPNDVVILTFGSNWYFNRHAAKLTIDFLWALDPILPLNIDPHQIAVTDPTSTGLLFDADGQADQTALRAQLQLLF